MDYYKNNIMPNYIKLTWKNTCDLGGVFYSSSGFINEMFIDVDIIKPEYNNEEIGQENGNGVFIKTSQKLKKRYKFELIAPEYVADALAFMALHDTIRLMFVNGLYSTEIRNVKVSVNWEDFLNDCMATIEVSFEQDDQVLKTACCDNLT